MDRGENYLRFMAGWRTGSLTAPAKILKQLLPLFVLIASGISVFGNALQTEKNEFDIADFNKQFEVAQWLFRYDTVAWKTTDLVMAGDKEELARLGREWFCFQAKDGLWHAVYGKLANNKFDQVFHYVVDASGKITKTLDKIDEAFVISHARALALAVAKLSESVPADSPNHNSYIRQNPDKSFTVWLLPAFQTNGSLSMAGNLFIRSIRVGKRLRKTKVISRGPFAGLSRHLLARSGSTTQKRISQPSVRSFLFGITSSTLPVLL